MNNHNYMRLVSSMNKTAGGAGYLVDDYSPLVAYSVEKISSTATVCCRVRRISDNAEQDIGFSGDLMDVADVETFVGTGNQALLVTVYNQGTGGATYDVTQSTASSQGIVTYTALIPEYDMSTGASVWKPPLIVGTNFTYKTGFTVATVQTQNLINFLCGRESTDQGLYYNGSYGGINGLGGFVSPDIRSLTGEDLNEHLGYFNMKSSKFYGAKDGASEADLGAMATSMEINAIGGRSLNSSLWLRGSWKELVFFNSDETSNKTDIETNINDRYSIY